MRKHLKHYFVPHKGNEFKPSFFRFEAVALTLVLVAGSFFLASSILQTQPYLNFLAAVYPGVLVAYTNEGRSALENESALSVSGELQKAAQLKANDMAARGYFSHVSPDGKTPWHWFDSVGYAFKYAGENLAVNFEDSKEVYDAWLASPEHKANILNSKFTEIGIATAEGVYKDKKAVFIVQLFGAPAQESLSAEALDKVSATPKILPEANATSEVSATIPPVNEKQVAGSFKERDQAAARAGLPAGGVGLAQSLLASPRTTLGWLYLAVMGIIVALLLLAGVMEFKLTHHSVWINGLILILVSLLFFLANNYIHLAGQAIG
jgi:uncharacterized protein YkwD